MLGCGSQWYEYVPGLVKVKLKDIPVAKLKLSKAPPSAVTVWGTESWFVHVMVVPTGTVRLLGEKAKPEIFTALA